MENVKTCLRINSVSTHEYTSKKLAQYGKILLHRTLFFVTRKTCRKLYTYPLQWRQKHTFLNFFQNAINTHSQKLLVIKLLF